MPRSLAILLACGLLLLGSLAFATGTSAATLAPTTTCSNGVDTTPGLGLICEVDVTNTFTPLGGTAVVTVRECHGAAGDPQAACTTETQTLTQPVTAVTQCNGSISSGGTLRCSIEVTNRYVGVDPAATAVTVNQCVGSGDGITTGCDPFPATTTGATITQCNGSANGGTLVGLTCTALGTQSAAGAVQINQCNGSANGGGSLVICSADITNTIIAGATPTPTTAPTTAPTAAPTAAPTTGGATPGTTPGVTPPTTDATATNGLPGSGPTQALLASLFVLAFVSALTVIGSRRYLRSTRHR